MTEYARAHMYVDAGYVRAELADLRIDPLFGTTELLQPFNRKRIHGRFLTVSRVEIYDAIDRRWAVVNEPADETSRRRAEQAKALEQHVKRLRRLENTHVHLGELVGEKKRRQKGVDVKITVDMLKASQARIVDYMILVAGDADFVPLLEAIKENGTHITAMGFSGMAEGLIESADSIVYLADDAQRFWGIR